jgi:hypothetical protein
MQANANQLAFGDMGLELVVGTLATSLMTLEAQHARTRSDASDGGFEQSCVVLHGLAVMRLTAYSVNKAT